MRVETYPLQVFLPVLAVLASTVAGGGQSALARASLALIQDPAQQHLVHREPSMQHVEVRKDESYWTRDDQELRFDLYLPPGVEEGASLPTVLLMNGSAPALKDWAQYVDWGRLCAASGLAAVSFQARRDRPEDFDDLLVNLTERAEELHLDLDRVASWSCSANTRFVVPWVMHADRAFVKCAVFYYGVMTPGPLREGLPVLAVRAGLDDAIINDSIDAFVQAALEVNAPLTLINHAAGQHGFDVRDDNQETRRIIRRTIQFLRSQLGVE